MEIKAWSKTHPNGELSAATTEIVEHGRVRGFDALAKTSIRTSAHLRAHLSVHLVG